MNVQQSMMGYSLLVVIAIGVGVWLSRTGRPYNTSIFTIHKLLGVGAVIFLTVLVTNAFKTDGSILVILTLSILLGIAMLILFVTGALLSLELWSYNRLKALHGISTIVAVISSAVLVMIRLTN